MYSVIFLLLFFGSAFSFQNVVKGQDILKAVQKYYLDSKSMDIEFSVDSYNPLLGSNYVYQGSIYIKGNDFRLKTPSLEWVRLDCLLWKYSKTNEQVTISDKACDNEDLNPLNLVNKILNWNLEKVAQYTKVRKDPQYKLNFIPEEDFYETASLFVSASFVPRRLILVDVADNRVTYHFKKVTRNVVKEISFRVPRGVEIIDLR